MKQIQKGSGTMQYDIKLTPDEGTWLVTFPDFPDAITFGDDQDEAILHAQNALDEVIAARIADREEIPCPKKSTRRGHIKVPLDVTTEGALLLYWSMNELGIRKADLARAMEVDAKQIDRLLDVTHQSSVRLMQQAFAAMGKRMTIQLRDAA